MTLFIPRKRILTRLPYLIPVAFLAIFFFYPLAHILSLSLTFEAIGRVLTTGYFGEVLWFTTWQAALSTVLTLVVGLPAGYLFAHYSFKGKSLLRALTAVPFVMPTVVVATAFRALFNPAGSLNRLLITLFQLDSPPIQIEQTLTIILLAHVFYNVTIVVRLVGGFWANLNPRTVEAARILGATRWQAFFEITLPVLRPVLIAAGLLIYLFTFTSFGVILLLGGASFSTLETEIYSQYVTFLRPDIAATLSLIQIIFTFIFMSLYARWQRKSHVALDLRPEQANLRSPQTWQEKTLVGLLVTGLTLFLIAPLFSLVLRSLLDSDGNLTVAYYAALPTLRRGSIIFVPPLQAIQNSLGYALLTVVLAGLFGTISARWLTQTRAKWLDPIFMLPLGASAVTLGFGYVVTFVQLRTSPVLVLVAHTLVAFPFVVRTVLPVLQGIKPSLREAASVMGASPAQVWREVDLPITGRALLVASMFAFTVSMGEFGATSFIVRPNSGYLTMPIAIGRYLGQPGALNFGQVLAMSTILMLVCTLGFLFIERFRYADIGEF